MGGKAHHKGAWAGDSARPFGAEHPHSTVPPHTDLGHSIKLGMGDPGSSRNEKSRLKVGFCNTCWSLCVAIDAQTANLGNPVRAKVPAQIRP
ncbi:hypothetical protein GCM10025772_15690 [Ferrimonas gelatinilytica]|uniref:Uncharacterized protein n=1 Tax=Ferrimonas gelatinilytica TaxID=1255257 RepID=A0ABP9S452_9GAMM